MQHELGFLMFQESILSLSTLPHEDFNLSSLTEEQVKQLRNSIISCGQHGIISGNIPLQGTLTLGQASIKLKISFGDTPNITLEVSLELPSVKEN